MLKQELRERNQKQNNKNVKIDLQLNLLNTWNNSGVADYYQNIFLLHLDELTPSKAQELIKKQISLTLQNKSPYFQLSRLEQKRKLMIQKLKNSLNIAQKHETQAKISQICQQIKQLREINLVTAEQILKMYNIYHCTSIQSSDKQMDYYDSLFIQLDRDNHFLKDSVLSKYLTFDDGYDPFLMNEYEHIQRNADQIINPAIKDLFNLNISFTYRLMKAKNFILKLRALVNHFSTSNIIEHIIPETFKQQQFHITARKTHSKGHFSRIKAAKHSQPIKIQPINIYPSAFAKSITTTYRQKDKDEKPSNRSHTEGDQRYRLKFAKVIPEPPSSAKLMYISKKSTQIERENAYDQPAERIQTRKSLELQRRFKHFQKQIYNQKRLSAPKLAQPQQKPEKYRGVGLIYKPAKLIALKNEKEEVKSQRKQNFQLPALPQNIQVKQLIEHSPPMIKQVKHYNPIKKQQYSTYVGQPKKSKYDFVGQAAKHQNRKQIIIEQSAEQGNGLIYEQPISKFNLKRKPKLQKKINSENPVNKQEFNQMQSVKQRSKKDTRVDQECQTFQPREASNKQPSDEKPSQQLKKEAQNKTINKQPQTLIQQKQPLNSSTKVNNKPNIKVLKTNQEEQPAQVNKHDNQGLPKEINTYDKSEPYQKQPENTIKKAITKNIPIRPEQNGIQKPEQAQQQPENIHSKNSNQSPLIQNAPPKKQIRMKIGKANIDQVIQLIKKSKIPQDYLNSFDLQKTLGWIKISQTYLTQFTVNDQTAVIALCSPIPNVGIALKFWASVHPQIELNAASNLFKKYLEFIQKVSSSQKIMFSGKPFKELQAGQFWMKKQNLYERIRKTPAPLNNQQFKPFLYIQCSNIKFSNLGKNKMLYSEQIQQFTPQNSYSISFLAEVDDKNVPSSIESLIKFDANLENFKKVNEILTKQNFDNYQTSQIQATNIDLMRLYLNCPLKSTFIVQDNCCKLIGTLLHQKDQECVVSVGINKNNSTMYFAKNVEFPQFLELIKKSSTNRVNFTLNMFSKKLYGKMPEVEGGCYGNWQVNFTWQDQLQGRIRHNMKENIAFGPQNFKVLIELEKAVALGFEVNKEDFI